MLRKKKYIIWLSIVFASYIASRKVDVEIYKRVLLFITMFGFYLFIMHSGICGDIREYMKKKRYDRERGL